jgi:hypothetical protein
MLLLTIEVWNLIFLILQMPFIINFHIREYLAYTNNCNRVIIIVFIEGFDYIQMLNFICFTCSVSLH